MNGVYRLAPEERETVANFNDRDETASVFTWHRRIQRQLLANSEARLVDQGTHKDPEDRWMKFEVPKSWIVIRPPKKMNLTTGQRQALAERLKAGRANTSAALV